MTATHPLVLMDQPEDGFMETLGWVEATVTEDEARDRLTPFCCDEHGDMGFRPTGPASKTWLRPEVPLISEDYASAEEHGYPIFWVEAKPGDEDAREFWEIVAA